MRWECLRVEPGTITSPTQLPADGWRPVDFPGAVGVTDADSSDWWLRTTVTLDPRSASLPTLRFDGLSTYATVFVDDTEVVRSANAFRRGEVALGSLAPGGGDGREHRLSVLLEALGSVPVPRKPRARWRSSLIPDSSLRWRRTPDLGRIPSWRGATPPVGVLGELTLGAARPTLGIVRADLQDDGSGVVDVELGCLADVPTRVALRRADSTQPIVEDEIDWQPGDPALTGRVRLEVTDVERWWPHTHGTPSTYLLEVRCADEVVEHRVIGFSTVVADRTDGRFGLVVNDVPVFVRGACWVPTDPVHWTVDAATARTDLARLAAAGFNLVRITGTNRYEPAAVWDAAAELGLLVWQDVMLSTFDPPEDPAWLADFEAEVVDQLTRLTGRPNLAVVAGGTETEQQPTLMGLSPDRYVMTAVHELLPRVCATVVPAAVHITSSPSGGPLPVSIAHGVSHYFGVGAYLRPLDDARSARVSFASEALAFAIPPSRAQVVADFGPGPSTGRGTAWRDGIPSDRGVDWDFEDVTDHYVTDVFDLRRADVDTDRWLDLQRAALAHTMTRAMEAWRSSDTVTQGAVILSHRDLTAGPGWGLLDHRGGAKAPLLALGEVLRPLAVLAVDRGLDGLLLDVVNDGDQPVYGTLAVEVFATGARPVLDARTELSVPPHGHQALPVEPLLGGFRDLTYAWRFGERTYRALRATVTDLTGEVLVDRTVLLGPPVATAGRPDEAASPLQASARRDGDDVVVTVSAAQVMEFLHLDLPTGYAPDRGWFHLAPGQQAEIRCTPAPRADVPPHDPADNPAETVPVALPPVTVRRLGGEPLDCKVL